MSGSFTLLWPNFTDWYLKISIIPACEILYKLLQNEHPMDAASLNLKNVVILSIKCNVPTKQQIRHSLGAFIPRASYSCLRLLSGDIWPAECLDNLKVRVLSFLSKPGTNSLTLGLVGWAIRTRIGSKWRPAHPLTAAYAPLIVSTHYTPRNYQVRSSSY